MLDVKVLGTGCAGCLKLEQLVIETLQTLGVREAKPELVTDERVIEYVLIGDQMPGLLINGKLVYAGRIPTEPEVMQ